MLRWWAEKRAPSKDAAASRRERGILFGSGMVGGEGLLGVGIAGAAGYARLQGATPWKIGYGWAGTLAPALAALALLALAAMFWRLVTRRG